MTRKEYDWKGGAKIGDHTRKKHSILERYLREYLITRCQLPQQERFRLILVDAFAGGGLYEDQSYGSPLIFVETLASATRQINIRRADNGIKPVNIECILILNDKDVVVRQLRSNIAPLLAKARDTAPRLDIKPEFHTLEFLELYPRLVKRINAARCRNVLLSLDQYGYSSVTSDTISDAIGRWRNAEIFLTFSISSLLAFLSPTEIAKSVAFDAKLVESLSILREESENLLNKRTWLGEAEKIVFAHFRSCARFVSPFSIHNPLGWRYWLMHFSNSHRARQVYNNLLHEDPSVQAHYGGAGLNMLSYNPEDDTRLYLFDEESRERALHELIQEVPTIIAESGNILPVSDFYKIAYSATPAHADDIHEAITENPDIDVVTPNGGQRRKSKRITLGDTLRLKRQTRFSFPFR